MQAAEKPPLRLVPKPPPFRWPTPNIGALVGLWIAVLGGMTLAANDPPSNLPELAGFIRDVGFPIAVSAFVLIRIEPAMRDLTRVVTKLEAILERLDRD